MDTYTTVLEILVIRKRERGVGGRDTRKTKLVCLQSVEKLSSTEAYTEQELNLVQQNIPHASSCNGIAYETLWPYTTFELLKAASNTSFASIVLEQSSPSMFAQIGYYGRHIGPGFCNACCGRGRWWESLTKNAHPTNRLVIYQ